MDGALFGGIRSSQLLRLGFCELKSSSAAVNVLVVADGEVDNATAPALAMSLQEAIQHATATPPGVVVVDLAKVTFMSAAGVRTLLAARTATHPLRIVAPSRPALRVIALAAPSQFVTYPTINDALRLLPME